MAYPIIEALRFAPFLGRKRESATETKEFPLDIRIMKQIHRNASVGFPREVIRAVRGLSQVGGLTEEQYVRDVVFALERQIGHPTEEELERMLVIDPRVPLEKQIELFKFSCLLRNPNLAINRSDIGDPASPYTIVLCDPPPIVDPNQRYKLDFFTTWFPHTVRCLTGAEEVVFLYEHPKLVAQHHDLYFPGSTYGGKPLKATTDDEKFILDCEGPWMEKFPRQVPLCKRKR